MGMQLLNKNGTYSHEAMKDLTNIEDGFIYLKKNISKVYITYVI